MADAVMRVLFVELGSSHDEVLLSYYRDMRALNATIFVTCPAHVWKRLEITDAAGWLEAEARGSLIRRLRAILRIRRYAIRNKITHVVLNTAAGTTLRDLSIALPSRCTVFATLHEATKLVESSNQRVITRNVDAYTVLAPYLLDLVPPQFPKPVVVVTASARDTTLYPHLGARSGDEKKPLSVVIAGGINWSRRDYDSLFSDTGFATMGEHVRFVLAGGPDPEDRDRLARMLAKSPPGSIEIHDGYIPHDVYAKIIHDADVVLPLTHPVCSDYHRYVRSRISGAMSSAWAFAKPLMLERGFQVHASLSDSIFYDVDRLPELLRQFAADRSLLTRHAVTPSFATDTYRRNALRALIGVST